MARTNYYLTHNGQRLATAAYTKGEARADFKSRLNIDKRGRLPVGAVVKILKK